MTSTSLSPRAAFEHWYADMRTPAATEAMVSDELSDMSEHFQRSDSFKVIVDNEFVVLANNRDIQGLLRAAESPTAQLAIEEAKKGRRPEITYCVAHMLVDGSGHEDFAREWISNHGPSGRGCAAVVRDLCKKERELHKVEVQRLLGLATLQDFFQQPKADASGAKERGFWNTGITELCDKDHDSAQVAFRANILAAILRQEHPDAPPSIDYLDGGSWHAGEDLIDTCWRGPARYQNLLPALELAYGNDDPEVTSRMRQSLSDLISAGQITTLRGTANDTRWDAIVAWCTPELAIALWQSHVTIESMPFISVVGGTAEDLAIQRCEQLQAIGFQGLDDHVDFRKEVSYEVPEGGMVAFTLLHQATIQASSKLVGWLLSQGCDPTKRSINTVDPHSQASSIEFADASLMAQDVGLPDTLRAAAASRAARSALADLELDIELSKGRRP